MIVVAGMVIGPTGRDGEVRAQGMDSIAMQAPPPPPPINWEASAEFFTPANANRRIRTINLNASVGATLVRDMILYVYGGLTATYAWGDITQATDGRGDTTLRNVAAGIGPFYVLRWVPFTLGKFSLSLNIGHAFILYSEHFPAGGDIYNVMYRVGPDIMMRIGDIASITAGYRWMHVSNGQGLGPFNPSYEGRGVDISFTSRF